MTLTGGLRADRPTFPDEPSRNPAAEASFGFRTDETGSEDIIWSPRVGFNYSLELAGRESQLRGGTGIFAGRPPYVWVSNQYSNTGIEFTRISAFLRDFDLDDNFIPFSPDPFDQPRAFPGIRVATNEINVIDPDFQFPTVWRTTLGYDIDVGFLDMTATVEGMYSETQEDVLFQNLNVVPTGETLAFDGRPTFTRKNRDFRDVILLTNTSRGEQWNVAVKLERPFREGWFGRFSYVNGESKVINDGTSSQARSNWRFLETQGDPNNPPIGFSDFDVEHRFNASLSYNFDLGPVNSTVSLFYNAQSGQPYSTIFFGDVNGDGERSNDLFYVPVSEDEIIIEGDGSWELLNEYIETDEGLRNARGQIVRRNASRAPWIHLLDFHWDIELPIQRFRPRISVDIQNFGNLIDSDSGEVQFVPFNAVSPVSWEGIDDETGKP
ncbi:MAG: hypothetical protein R3324_06115, partial [Halobacteriales archaeon]|nr:hypothetical protein [Halobacteriales archaeon]